jgi:hypothetical protein
MLSLRLTPKPNAPLWVLALFVAGYVVLGWIACLALGVGTAEVVTHFGCHGPEVGDPGGGICSVIDALGGLALLAAFGAPLFILAILGSLVVAAFAFIFRRKG